MENKDCQKDFQNGNEVLSFQNITNYKLLYDNILIKAIDITSVKGVIRSKRTEDKPVVGKVVSVGSGRVLDTGGMKKMEVKVGDVVLFNQYMTTKYNLNKEEYFLIREEDIVGYIR